MNLVEKSQIAANMLNIYEDIQKHGETPALKRHVLKFFHEIINANDINMAEAKVLEFINTEVGE